MTTKFETEKTYYIAKYHRVEKGYESEYVPLIVTKRTAKTIWFSVDGKEGKTSIKFSQDCEYIENLNNKALPSPILLATATTPPSKAESEALKKAKEKKAQVNEQEEKIKSVISHIKKHYEEIRPFSHSVRKSVKLGKDQQDIIQDLSESGKIKFILRVV